MTIIDLLLIAGISFGVGMSVLLIGIIVTAIKKKRK